MIPKDARHSRPRSNDENGGEENNGSVSPRGHDLEFNKRRDGGGNRDRYRHDASLPSELSIERLPGKPLIVRREDHTISRKFIDPDALKVMRRLNQFGYRAFLVGGSVRDLLLGKTPKDFDIGTDARPETVRSIFRNSRIIGRRFKLNQVFFGGNKNFEVSTFRDNLEPEADSEAVLVTSDNVYGDPETDAFRRDLTINGLFYDLSSFSVIDYVGGLDDLHNGIVRVIGDPEVRFREDPVRMIRTIRHAARTGFKIEDKSYKAIINCVPQIELASEVRVLDELLRELRGGVARKSFELMIETGLFDYILPALADALKEQGDPVKKRLFRVLERFDAAVRGGKVLSSAHMFGAMLVGNLPQSMMKMPAAGSEEKPSAWEVWLELPSRAIESSGGDQDSTTGESLRGESEGNEQTELPQRRRRFSRGRSSYIRSEITDTIDIVCEGMTMYRRDREHLENLLLGRARLFAAFAENRKDRSLLANPRFEDWFLFLLLTAHSEESEAAILFWEPGTDGYEDDIEGNNFQKESIPGQPQKYANRNPRNVRGRRRGGRR